MQNDNPYAAYTQQQLQQQPQQPVQQPGVNPTSPKNNKIAIILLSIGCVLFLVLAVVQTISLSSERSSREKLVSQAVEDLRPEIRQELQLEFDEEAKKPNKVFKSDSQYGSLKFAYPKTWSGHLAQKESGSNPFSFTAHPDVVPADAESYALRVAVVNSSYSDELEDYQKGIEKGQIKSSVFKNSGVTGVKLVGAIDKFNGQMVLLPLRDKTIKVWTESSSHSKDYANILKSFSFEP